MRLAKPASTRPAQMAVIGGAWHQPFVLQCGDIDIHPRVGGEERDHRLEPGPAGMHHVEAEPLVTEQHLLQQQGIAERDPKRRET